MVGSSRTEICHWTKWEKLAQLEPLVQCQRSPRNCYLSQLKPSDLEWFKVLFFFNLSVYPQDPCPWCCTAETTDKRKTKESVTDSTFLTQPLIVMMMMAFFTQWRFDDECYTLADTKVLIPNGAAVFAAVLFLWYFIWGLVQGAYLMGVRAMQNNKKSHTVDYWNFSIIIQTGLPGLFVAAVFFFPSKY